MQYKEEILKRYKRAVELKMESTKYSIYCNFDINKHKETYTDYLEVIIDQNGKVMYAIPSHQEKLIQMACSKLNCTRQELNDMCPKEYYCDFITWLCKITHAVSVWNNFYIAYSLNQKQRKKLLQLKEAGIFWGVVR